MAGRIDDVGLAAERVAEAAEAAHAFDRPLVLTGRCENHIRGVDDLDDTIARLVAYRDAGADCLYAPGLTSRAGRAVVDAVGAPVNVLALRGPAGAGARRARGAARLDGRRARLGAAYGALLAGARELLSEGTSTYTERGMKPADRDTAFG